MTRRVVAKKKIKQKLEKKGLCGLEKNKRNFDL